MYESEMFWQEIIDLSSIIWREKKFGDPDQGLESNPQSRLGTPI